MLRARERDLMVYFFFTYTILTEFKTMPYISEANREIHYEKKIFAQYIFTCIYNFPPLGGIQKLGKH